MGREAHDIRVPSSLSSKCANVGKRKLKANSNSLYHLKKKSENRLNITILKDNIHLVFTIFEALFYTIHKF